MTIIREDMLGQSLEVGDLITVAISGGRSPVLTVDKIRDFTDSEIIADRIFPNLATKPIHYLKTNKMLKLGESEGDYKKLVGDRHPEWVRDENTELFS